MVVSNENTVDVSLEVEFLDSLGFDVNNEDETALAVAVPCSHNSLKCFEIFVFVEDVGVVKTGNEFIANKVVEIHIRVLVWFTLVEVERSVVVISEHHSRVVREGNIADFLILYLRVESDSHGD